jgi:NAD(P)H-nitrite reductase large subunit
MKVVIIGLSAAGLSCLETLLRFSPGSEISVVSEEKCLPYCRCILTEYLGREVEEGFLTVRDTSHFPPNVTFLPGECAVSIDPPGKTVALQSGVQLRYDKLLIATGANAVRPDYCSDENRVFTLRYIDDVFKIERLLDRKATVVGGGFIGIKTAYGLKKRGIDVEVVESLHLLSTWMDERESMVVEDDLGTMGISINKGDEITQISIGGDIVTAALKSGKELKSNVVVAGIGIVPRTELAQRAGILTETGILVNEFLGTSVKDIYAAGDCCEAMDTSRNRPWVNAVWPVAVEQGYFAALNMTGMSASYPGSIAMNSLKTPDFHLITAGLLKKAEDITFYEEQFSRKRQFRMIAVRGDIPVGMMFYNAAEDAGPVIRLIRSGKPLTTVKAGEIVRGEASVYDMMKLLS